MRLELLHVRTHRERPLAAAAHDNRPDIAGRGPFERRQGRVQLIEEFTGHEVQRRIDELEVGDRAQLQLDEPAHDAAPKSAARPIGPVA